MTATFLGPYAGVTNGPSGWVNFATGAGTFKNRYDDGDPVASLIYRELAGDVNYELAQSRREVWPDAFVPEADGATDPTHVNVGTTWSIDSIYAWTPAIIITPNARRGVDQPPRLKVRVRARMDGGAGAGKVRVYSVATYAEIQAAWDGPNNAYRTTDIAVASAAYPLDANEGLLPAGGDGNAVALELACSRLHLVHPAFGLDGEVGMDVLVTHLVLCGTGDGAANGPLIAAVEISEEPPAA